MTKILITGGSGFIGTNLIEHFLLNQNIELLSIDIEKPKISAHNRIWKQINICDKESVVLSCSRSSRHFYLRRSYSSRFGFHRSKATRYIPSRSSTPPVNTPRYSRIRRLIVSSIVTRVWIPTNKSPIRKYSRSSRSRRIYWKIQKPLPYIPRNKSREN